MAAKDSSQNQSPVVRSVAKALGVLEYLSTCQDPVGVREISRQLKFGAGTTQKLLNTLRESGFVEQDPLTQRYSLGLKVLQIGIVKLDTIEVRSVARPHLEQLRRDTGETIFLGIRDGDHVVYIDKVESTQPVRMHAELGFRRPLNATATGKAHLAHLPAEEFERLYRDGAFVRMTVNTIVDRAPLLEELDRTRARGFAVDNEEFAIGVRCVAAPVFDHKNHLVAAVTLAGPASRLGPEIIGRHAEDVRSCAARVSNALGHLRSLEVARSV